MNILQTLAGWFRRDKGSTTMENPSTWLIDVLGGGTSTAGVQISRDVALTLDAVWRAVNLISTDVAKIPMHVYRRAGEGKERATDHAAYRLLLRQPAPWYNAWQFKKTITADALLNGAGYAWIRRDQAGLPAELWALRPETVAAGIVGNQLVYRLRWKDTEYYAFDEDILAIKGLTTDGITPYSWVDRARESLGLAVATRNYGSRFFKRDAKPGIAITFPIDPGPQKRAEFRDAWQREYGPDGKHGVAVLGGGGDLKTFSLSNEDSQFLETRQFSVREVANWFGLPPHKLGDPTRTGYASLEQENQAYLDECLDGWFTAWESECNLKLLSAAEQAADSHLVEFMRQALLRADTPSRYRAYAIGIQFGILSRNEVRSMENLNPYEGGDEFVLALNVGQSQPADEGNEEEPGKAPSSEPETEPAEDSRAFRLILGDALARLEARIGGELLRATRRPQFCDWVQAIPAAFGRATAYALRGPAAVAVRGNEAAADARAKLWAEALLGTLRQRLWDATETTTEAELPARAAGILRDVLSDTLTGDPQWSA